MSFSKLASGFILEGFDPTRPLGCVISKVANFMTSKSSNAYVAYLAAGNEEDVRGLVVLAKSLRKAKCQYPLVVATLPDVSNEHRRILRYQGCVVRDIEPLYPPENSTQFDKEDYVRHYSKLRIFEFEEYSRMIYLDKHIQVFKNIDHLFDLPDGHLYGVMDCFCEKAYWSHTPQFKIGYCQQCPDKVKWPSEFGPKPAHYFNAGMFVYEPNISTYQDLLNTLKITPPTPFAEQNLQDFLNRFFKDIYKPISPIYNLVLPMLWHHPENVELDKARVVHYCGAPWRYTGNEQNMEREDVKMLVQKWWDIYNDESLDYKNRSSPAAASEAEAEVEVVAEAHEDVILQPILEGLWEAAGCCSVKDLCLQPFLADVSEVGCFPTVDLSLQPFLETLWEVGCGVIEDLTSLTELYMGGYRCGGFVFWF